jgi:hypothetical protein
MSQYSIHSKCKIQDIQHKEIHQPTRTTSQCAALITPLIYLSSFIYYTTHPISKYSLYITNPELYISYVWHLVSVVHRTRCLRCEHQLFRAWYSTFRRAIVLSSLMFRPFKNQLRRFPSSSIPTQTQLSERHI